MKVVYTDGACRRNPEGRWLGRVILSDGNAEPEIVGRTESRRIIRWS